MSNRGFSTVLHATACTFVLFQLGACGASGGAGQKAASGSAYNSVTGVDASSGGTASTAAGAGSPATDANGVPCPTASGAPVAGNGNIAVSPNQALPTFAQQAQWFNSQASAYRLTGIGVNVTAPASLGQGKTLRVSIVRDRTSSAVVTRKSLIGTQGASVRFPAMLPLPNDPNGVGDTFTARACIDSDDVSVCDGPVWQVPITQDYQNTLGSKAVHFAFDQNGVQSPYTVSNFIVTLDLNQAVADTNRALEPSPETSQAYSFSVEALPNTAGNPGSSAEFIVIGNLRVLDTDTNTIVYMDGAPDQTALSDPNFTGLVHLTPDVMQPGKNYQVLMYTFRGNEDCELGRPCGAECTQTITNASQDVLLTKPIDSCTAIP